MSFVSINIRNIFCNKETAYGKRVDRLRRLPNIVLAIALAIMILLGYFYSKIEDNIIIIYIKDHIIESLVLLCVTTAVCFIVLSLVYSEVSKINQRRMNEEKDNSRTLPTYWGVIFLCWLPYLIINMPASSIGWDYTWQLLQGSGVVPMTNHHPVLGSIIYGLLYKIGFIFGGAYGGLFFTDLFQLLLMSFSMAFALATVRKIGCSKVVARLLLIYTCVCPIFASHAVWLIKDSIYSSLIVLTFSLCLNIFEDCARSILPLIMIVITAVSAIMYRSEAFIVIGLLYLTIFIQALLIKNRFYIKRIGFTTIFAIFLLCFTKIAISTLDIPPTSMSRESLTIFSAQIINCLKKYPYDVSESEMSTLRDSYMNLDDAIEAYNDINRDYLKTVDMGIEKMMKYLEIWKNLGLQHPGDYIDTLLRGTTGYWSIFRDPFLIPHTTPLYAPEDDFANEKTRDRLAMENGWLKMTYEAYGLETDKTIGELVSENNPDLEGIFYVESAFPLKRNWLKKVMDVWKEIPFLNLVFLPGFYLMISIVSLGYLFHTNKRVFFICVPIMMIVILISFSPINGYMRYFLPVAMFSIPMIGLCFSDL